MLLGIVGGLKNEEYKIDDERYEVREDGLLGDVDFDLVEERKDRVSFEYE